MIKNIMAVAYSASHYYSHLMHRGRFDVAEIWGYLQLQLCPRHRIAQSLSGGHACVLYARELIVWGMIFASEPTVLISEMGW